MKSIRFIICYLALIPLTLFAQAPNPIVIRVAHSLSDDSHLGRAVAKFGERVERESKGRIIVKPMGNSSAGSDTKAMQDTMNGKLEMFISATTTIVPAYKPMAIWDTPFLFANFDEAHAIMDGKVGQKILDGLSQGGLVGLAYWESGFRNMTNNVRPVAHVEDFAGIKLRTMPSEIALNTFKRLGVDAKPLPFPELHAALQNGTFDGQENPYPSIVSAKLYEVQKYLTVTNHMYSPYGVVASRKWWLTLSPADQKIIRDAAWDTRIYQREESQKAAAAALLQIKKAGVKVNELAVGERSRISRLMERVDGMIANDVGLPLWLEASSEIADYKNKKN